MNWPWRHRARWAVVTTPQDADTPSGVYTGFRDHDDALAFAIILAVETGARDDTETVTCSVHRVETT